MFYTIQFQYLMLIKKFSLRKFGLKKVWNWKQKWNYGGASIIFWPYLLPCCILVKLFHFNYTLFFDNSYYLKDLRKILFLLDFETPYWVHHQWITFDLPSHKVNHNKHNTQCVSNPLYNKIPRCNYARVIGTLFMAPNSNKLIQKLFGINIGRTSSKICIK
jgi:hypothetical protein